MAAFAGPLRVLPGRLVAVGLATALSLAFAVIPPVELPGDLISAVALAAAADR